MSPAHIAALKKRVDELAEVLFALRRSVCELEKRVKELEKSK